MTISFKVSEETKEKLKEFYEDLKREKTPDYATFQAQDGDTIVTLYDSGKIVFQGRDADLASDFWIATEKMVNQKLEVKNSEKKQEKNKEVKKEPSVYYATTIGSDEVGTGDVFGPIVVTGAYVSKEQIPFIESLGITDSKKMTDEKIKEVVPKLIKNIKYTTFTLNNEAYNQYSKQINMNKMKALLHNKVLFSLTQKHPSVDYIVVDEFAKPYLYYNYLKEVPHVVKNITFLTKGETKCLSVACASVISRYIFLREVEKLEESVGSTLPKGAGPKVDEKIEELVAKHGFSILEKIAKMNFKNIEKIKK